MGSFLKKRAGGLGRGSDGSAQTWPDGLASGRCLYYLSVISIVSETPMNRSDASSPRLAVFDCDGTLVDSQHMIVAAVETAWRGYGIAPPSADMVRRGVGLPLAEAIARLLPEGGSADHRALYALYKDAFHAQRAQSDHHEPLYPGVAETLDALAEAGVLLAVATGKSRRGLLATLDRHGLLDRFVTLRTADDGPGKPNPHMLLDAMAETGAAPADTVMIGDTTFDIHMAVAARTPAVGVSWGYHEPAELTEAGAHSIVDQFNELGGALAAIWGDGHETR